MAAHLVTEPTPDTPGAAGHLSVKEYKCVFIADGHEDQQLGHPARMLAMLL